MDLSDIPEDLKLNNNQLNKIAIIIDNLSKYAFVELIPTKSASDVLEVFMKYVNIRGKPKILLTDNGKEFINNSFKRYLEINNIEHRHTRPYNPKCNGIAERFIQTFKDMLKREYLKNKK